MDVINLNNNFRCLLLDNIEKLELKGLSFEDAINEFRDSLYEIEDDYSKQSIREQFISILYLDAIKMCMYIHKTGIVDDEVAILLCDLKKFDTKDDIVVEVSANPELFSKMIKFAYKYANIDGLSKKLIVKSMSSIENDWLSKMLPCHFFDIMQNIPSFTLEEIVEELKSNIKYQDKCIGMDLSDSNMLRIMGIIQDLSLYDRNGYFDLILSIAKTDYAVCKYLNKKIDDCPLLVDHIDFYENYSINDILFNLTTNQIFLKSSLWMVVSLYIDKQFDEIPIPDDVIEKEVSKKMIKKLTLE